MQRRTRKRKIFFIAPKLRNVFEQHEVRMTTLIDNQTVSENIVVGLYTVFMWFTHIMIVAYVYLSCAMKKRLSFQNFFSWSYLIYIHYVLTANKEYHNCHEFNSETATRKVDFSFLIRSDNPPHKSCK